eukprot:906596-Pleurochrysis_carterae.AAC.1
MKEEALRGHTPMPTVATTLPRSDSEETSKSFAASSAVALDASGTREHAYAQEHKAGETDVLKMGSGTSIANACVRTQLRMARIPIGAWRSEWASIVSREACGTLRMRGKKLFATLLLTCAVHAACEAACRERVNLAPAQNVCAAICVGTAGRGR